jgi:hypothetical protein
LASIFPSTPSLNDIFTSNGTTWQWNGEAWVVVADQGQAFNTVITNPSSQTISADSGTDTLTIAAGTNISVSGNASNDTLTISSTINTQDLINTASAAAYASASGYTNFIVDGLDTLDIEENTNLYFTNQRAIDATSSLITSASANALSEANAYTNSASSSLVAYTNQEVSALQLFSNISTSPSTQLITGDSNSDTLTFISGENISISADSSTDSITINSTGNYTNVDSISYPDYIVFDTTPENTSASTSTLAWDSGEGGLGLQLNANTQVTLGQEIIVLCNNGEATTLNKGEVVRFSGASGQKPQVTRAYNTSDAGSALTFGIVAESIASGEEGFVVTQGIVKNINTNAYNEGDILYLSASAGVLTTVKPQAPNHYVFVGVVIKKNSSSGRIYVKPQNGYELDELHDVRISGVANDDLIVYNSASSIWVNSPKQNIITTASAAAYASASAYTDSEINALTTTDIEEGTNLYFTNERAINAGSATYILQTNEQGIINSASAAAVTAVLDGAPGALDTLNELAAALGDDENFATSVTNSLSGKLDTSTASATYLTQAAYASASPNFATDAELANKLDTSTYASASANFATDAELESAIVTASAAAVAYADGLTTTDIAEGTNLYYTTSRGQETASTMFVHGNHTNVSAQYVSGEIRLTSSAAGGGGATVAYQTTQPDVTSLDAGSLWIDSDEDSISGLLPATFTRWVKILSASATTISGLDDNVLSLLYTAGYEKVFINGTLLVRGSDYTATTGDTVVLTTAAEDGDVVEIHAYESFQIADTYTQAQIDSKFNSYTRWSKIYSASATTITGVDDYSNSLSYTNNYERVFINGVLVDPSEYSRTSASVITPDETILSGDVVEVFNITSAQIGDTYTTSQADNKFLTQVSASTTYAPVAAGGMVLLNTTTFTSQSTVSINDVFSTTYDFYKIIIVAENSSGQWELKFRLRVSGSDNSSNNYYWSGFYQTFASSSPALNVKGSNGLTSSFEIGNTSSPTATLGNQHIVEIGNPFATSETTFNSSGVGYETSPGVSSSNRFTYGGMTSVTTSYTGFSFFPANGNLTGSVSVYGYKK